MHTEGTPTLFAAGSKLTGSFGSAFLAGLKKLRNAREKQEKERENSCRLIDDKSRLVLDGNRSPTGFVVAISV